MVYINNYKFVFEKCPLYVEIIIKYCTKKYVILPLTPPINTLYLDHINISVRAC